MVTVFAGAGPLTSPLALATRPHGLFATPCDPHAAVAHLPFAARAPVRAVKGFPDLPPLWLLGCLLLTWLLASLVPIVSFAGPISTMIAWVLTVGGLGLIAWSGMWFWRKRTTIEPHHTPEVLIVEGPYRVSRNPIYLGMITIAAGAVFWHGAFSALPLPAILAVVLQRRFIEPEEIALHMAFGDAALEYISSTRRWL